MNGLTSLSHISRAVIVMEAITIVGYPNGDELVLNYTLDAFEEDNTCSMEESS